MRNLLVLICLFALPALAITPTSVTPNSPKVTTVPEMYVGPLFDGSDDTVIVTKDAITIIGDDSSIKMLVNGHPTPSMIKFMKDYLDALK